MTEIRCENKLHATIQDGILEVKCRSRFCGAQPGVVVIHRFKAETGDLMETLQFRDPGREL